MYNTGILVNQPTVKVNNFAYRIINFESPFRTCPIRKFCCLSSSIVQFFKKCIARVLSYLFIAYKAWTDLNLTNSNNALSLSRPLPVRWLNIDISEYYCKCHLKMWLCCPVHMCIFFFRYQQYSPHLTYCYVPCYIMCIK